jgi:transposase
VDTIARYRGVRISGARKSARSGTPDANGPCGYGLHRHLIGLGHVCNVVAPSRTPVQPGKRRVKNDTIDALNLARLHRAGELTYIWTPDATHEAM